MAYGMRHLDQGIQQFITETFKIIDSDKVSLLSFIIKKMVTIVYYDVDYYNIGYYNIVISILFQSYASNLLFLGKQFILDFILSTLPLK